MSILKAAPATPPVQPSNKTKVTFGKLHYPIHTHKTGQIGPTLDIVKNGLNKAVVMYRVGDVIYCELPNHSEPGVTTVAVPISGFTHWIEEL